MKLIIQKEIVDTFKPIIGVMYVQGADNTKSVEEIGTLLEQVSLEVKQSFTQFESPSKHLFIAAWRQAFKKFGSDPPQYQYFSQTFFPRDL